MTAIGSLPALCQLDVSDNEIQAVPVDQMLAQLPFLELFDVSRNPLNGLAKNSDEAETVAAAISNRFKKFHPDYYPEGRNIPNFAEWRKKCEASSQSQSASTASTASTSSATK